MNSRVVPAAKRKGIPRSKMANGGQLVRNAFVLNDLYDQTQFLGDGAGTRI